MERDQLRKLGVHEGVIPELRPRTRTACWRARNRLGNARRSPGEDLASWPRSSPALMTAGIWPAMASGFAHRVEITAAVIDAIKAGIMVQFAVRDAIWDALS